MVGGCAALRNSCADNYGFSARTQGGERLFPEGVRRCRPIWHRRLRKNNDSGGLRHGLLLDLLGSLILSQWVRRTVRNGAEVRIQANPARWRLGICWMDKIHERGDNDR